MSQKLTLFDPETNTLKEVYVSAEDAIRAANGTKQHLYDVCITLAEQEKLQVTVKEAAKGAVLTGFGAFGGALIAGPIGLAIGGTLSSIMAAWYGRGKFRSVVDILQNDLTPTQKKKLTNTLSKALSSVKTEDYATLLTLVLSTASVKELIIAEIGTFLLKELQMQMVK